VGAISRILCIIHSPVENAYRKKLKAGVRPGFTEEKQGSRKAALFQNSLTAYHPEISTFLPLPALLPLD
jgi:hypothetical protein